MGRDTARIKIVVENRFAKLNESRIDLLGFRPNHQHHAISESVGAFDVVQSGERQPFAELRETQTTRRFVQTTSGPWRTERFQEEQMSSRRDHGGKFG